MRLKNKVAIITGGSRGIGRAVCIRFAKEGAKVIVNYADEADRGDFANAADKVVKKISSFGGEAVSYEANVTNKVHVDRMVDFAVKKYGRLDILVANAGICSFKKFLDIDEELLDWTIGVNLKGAFFCTQAAMRKMIELKIKGRIIFTSARSAIFGAKSRAHYAATKGAIDHLMKSIVKPAGKYGITSNAVMPGTVITDINREQLKSNKELINIFTKKTPLGRLATPEDIASAMLFFASDEASCISGVTLIVDGGRSVNLQ